MLRVPFRNGFYRPHPKDGEGYIFTLCVSPHLDGGGSQVKVQVRGGTQSSHGQGGGVLGLRFWGGYPVSDFQGGSQSQIFGGVPGLRFSGGSPVSDFQGGGYQVSVKGKIFDTRFGLIHVQTGKKNFCRGTPPPPSKGKNFWHQIWLDTCSDWEKKFLLRDPPPQ